MISLLKTCIIGILGLLVSVAAAAQTDFRGTWTAASDKGPDELQLNLYRSSKMQMGHTIAVSELQGLDAQAVHATNTPVKFELIRDAGIVQFEGTFDRDLGHG